MLTLYIDFKSPASYLAMKPTLALIQKLQLETRWRPFPMFERDVPLQSPNEAIARSHQRVRLASRQTAFTKYAKLQGIDLRFPEAPGKTDLALGVLHEISGNPLPYITAAFAAYWDQHHDLDDEAIVHELIKKSGVSYIGNFTDIRNNLVKIQEQAEAQGIFDAPAYVIDDHIFIGREHLPWIEDLALSSL